MNKRIRKKLRPRIVTSPPPDWVRLPPGTAALAGTDETASIGGVTVHVSRLRFYSGLVRECDHRRVEAARLRRWRRRLRKLMRGEAAGVLF